ncbi:cytochrome PufQ [Planktotalea sp.]|uniref:cytochrome PufQ n=1 Tax=Planktotalea sp. TaxID=2029877 RepID=UPI003F6D30D1
MTDFTNDASWSAQDGKSASATSTEYKVYFSLILLAALPICTLIWAFSTVRNVALPEQGPLRKAWSEAHSITPRIFWG